MKAIFAALFVSFTLPVLAQKAPTKDIAEQLSDDLEQASKKVEAKQMAAGLEYLAKRNKERAMKAVTPTASIETQESDKKDAELVEFQKKEQNAIAAAGEQYPEMLIEGSEFRSRLLTKLKASELLDDPIMKNPNRIYILAGHVAFEILKIRQAQATKPRPPTLDDRLERIEWMLWDAKFDRNMSGDE